jgi:ATP-dependent RNA circularization protein (DNA/RNA ligase family)
MKQYHKIQTIFKRDDNGKIIDSEWTLPEFEYLQNNNWIWTEKVDGTNIRVKYDPRVPACGGDHLVPWVTFGGKTDNAQIPAFLYQRLQELFPVEKFKAFDSPLCLYGEGYGAKIQKGGGNYKSDGVDFVLFDVKIGDWWLTRESVYTIASQLGIDIVPVIRICPIQEAIDLVKEGFESQWGNFIAEGLVGTPHIPLFSMNGSRIITKIKHRDFK